MNKFKFTERDVENLKKAEGVLRDASGPNILAVVRDLLYLGLYLSESGERSAGHKACSAALRVLDLPDALHDKILKYSKGNECLIAKHIWAHVELKKLFKEHSLDTAI